MNMSKKLSSLNLPFVTMQNKELEETSIPKLLHTTIQTKKNGIITLVYSDEQLLDLTTIEKETQDKVLPIQHEALADILDKAQANIWLEPNIKNSEHIIIEDGEEQYLSIATQTIEQIANQANWHTFAKHLATEELQFDLEKFTHETIIEYINAQDELPVIPSIAQKILKLQSNPNADVEDLTAIVEQSPSLAAQVVKWAASPYYGYPGEINSVSDAVVKVLGFDMVMNLALGLAIGNSFQVPSSGPIGLQQYWQHSIYTATLAEKLVKLCKTKDKPDIGIVYLSGLLHNFGYLLLGHMFPKHFNLINDLISINPHLAFRQIEKAVLGLSHDELGPLLMQAWQLPEAISLTVKHHHDVTYDGEFKTLVDLVLLATILLKQRDIGDAERTKPPASILEQLVLTEDNLNKALSELLENTQELDDIANKFV